MSLDMDDANNNDILIQNIENKMNKLIQNKNFQLFLFNKNLKVDNNTKSLDKTNFIPKCKQTFLKEEFLKNSCITLTSLFSYLVFQNSNYFKRVYSIGNYKKIFLTTFCLSPMLISLYFSYLDYNLLFK